MKTTHSILLVEDNPADIKIMQCALRDSGLAVDLITVRDGEEAVAYLLREGPFASWSGWKAPELVLLDLNLPRLNACQVLGRIRGQHELRAIPVVVLTTSRRVEDVRSVYAAGANSYVQKPQEYLQFVEALRTLGRYWFDTALLPEHAPAPSAAWVL